MRDPLITSGDATYDRTLLVDQRPVHPRYDRDAAGVSDHRNHHSSLVSHPSSVANTALPASDHYECVPIGRSSFVPSRARST